MAPAKLLREPICKWGRKTIEKHLSLLCDEVVATPRFVCQKCGRAAASRKNLCKGRRIRG